MSLIFPKLPLCDCQSNVEMKVVIFTAMSFSANQVQSTKKPIKTSLLEVTNLDRYITSTMRKIIVQKFGKSIIKENCHKIGVAARLNPPPTNLCCLPMGAAPAVGSRLIVVVTPSWPILDT